MGKKRRVGITWLALALLLAACAAPTLLPPPATPEVLPIAMTPSARSWQPALYACAATLPDLRLLIQEIPASQLVLNSGLVLRLGAPVLEEPFYAAQIGEEQMVLVLHPDNPRQSLSSESLRQLYTYQILDWSGLETGFSAAVQPWTYPSGDDLRQTFDAALWGATPPMVQAYLAPDPAAMLEAVSSTPGALGYLPLSWLANEEVKTVSTDDTLTSALRQPVLMIANSEPQGLARALIGCLQQAKK